jgi:phage gpG-like protein
MQLTTESNSAAIAQALSRAAQEITDTTPMMVNIGQQLETNIRDRFKSKTDPAGKAWEPHKAISAAIHEARTGKDNSGRLLSVQTSSAYPSLHRGTKIGARAKLALWGLSPHARGNH